jgi:hypothetical protein
MEKMMADQTFPDNVSVQGNLGVGGGFASSKKLNVNAQFNTDADNWGIYVGANQTAPSSHTLRGVASDFQYSGSGFLQGMNATDFTFIVGNGSSPSTVALAKSFSTFGVVKNNATAQQVRMVHIESPLMEGGSIGTLYGLYLGNMSQGGSNWAIYSQGGRCYFAGNVGIGVDNPVAPLHVRAANGVSLVASGQSPNGQHRMELKAIDDGGATWPMDIFSSGLTLRSYSGATAFSLIVDPTGVKAGPLARPVVNNIGEVLYS